MILHRADRPAGHWCDPDRYG